MEWECELDDGRAWENHRASLPEEDHLLRPDTLRWPEMRMHHANLPREFLQFHFEEYRVPLHGGMNERIRSPYQRNGAPVPETEWRASALRQLRCETGASKRIDRNE